MFNALTDKLKGFKNLFMDDIHTKHMKFLSSYEDQLQLNYDTETVGAVAKGLFKGAAIGAGINGTIMTATIMGGGALMGAFALPILVGTTMAASISLVVAFASKGFDLLNESALKEEKEKTSKMEKKFIDDFNYSPEDMATLKKSMLNNDKETKDNIIRTNAGKLRV